VAEIVGAFGVPHNPHFPTWVTAGHPLAGELERLYGEVARRLAAAAPDVVVCFTSDHYNLFWETVPVFAVAAAESAAGASDYPELRGEWRVDGALARELHAHLLSAGFDAAVLQELSLDHTLVAPLQLLRAEDLAVVPVFVNGLIRPLPSAPRCLALGRAIRAAIEPARAPTRVALLASGSFSLEIGGPRISADSHTGVPAPGWVERVLALLCAGDVERLVAEATPAQLWEAGNAGGELLDWIAMLGAIDPRPPAFLEPQVQFGHAYAAWTAA
jgi:aromatic ring-opening dioxygenase catalytic subunit (LigB family)